MAIFILSFMLLVAAVLVMSIGVLMGRKPIKGSCGGMSALGMETACDVCGGDKKKCEEEQERQAAAKQTFSKEDAEALAYDATKAGAADGK